MAHRRSEYEAGWAVACQRHSWLLDHLGSTFFFKSREYKIVGYNASATTRPIVAENQITRKLYVFKLDIIKQLLQNAPPAPTAPEPRPPSSAIRTAQVAKAAGEWERFSAGYGFSVGDLGATFQIDGKSYKILGCVHTRPKFPILCERAPDGKLFKMDAQSVQKALGKPPQQPPPEKKKQKKRKTSNNRYTESEVDEMRKELDEEERPLFVDDRDFYDMDDDEIIELYESNYGPMRRKGSFDGMFGGLLGI